MARKSKTIAGRKDAVRYERGDLDRGKAYRVEVLRPGQAKNKQGRQVHGSAGRAR
jgi:hypothetical protein